MPGRDIIQSTHLGAVRVSMALAKLGEWRRWTLGLPVSAALQKIFEDSGILNYYASLEMGRSRVGNVLKLLEIVRNEERKGGTAFAQVVKFLGELKEVRDIEEMSLTPARENAVRLMNLHKAKGLEAPVVFLANPVGIREHEVDKHMVRVGQLGEHQLAGHKDSWGTFPKGTPRDSRPMGYFAFSRRGAFQRKGTLLSQPVGWEEAAGEEEKYQASEEIRLMYVAATRARNMLVVSTYGGNLASKAWKMLDEALGDVPELEVQKSGRRREEREKLRLKKSDVEKARKEILESMKSAGEPGYAVETVTALAKKERKLPQYRHEAGLGLSWGRLVHQVLEAVGSGRLMLTMMGGHREESASDERTQQSPAPSLRLPRSGADDKVSIFSKKDRATIELFIKNLIAAEERDLSDKERLVAHIESILGSPFWRRVLRAEKKYFEIPFSIKTDRASLEATAGLGARSREATLPIILSGTIDLVFYEDGKGAGWVIADFKSDDIGTDPGVEIRLDDLVGYYAPQVRAYTRFWAEITGEPIKESGLYFTSLNRWVSI
jgi:ATP-dependent helicase/nuclease subunit A